MNKLKKVGLTALATTLVASSAYAGELSKWFGVIKQWSRHKLRRTHGQWVTV